MLIVKCEEYLAEVRAEADKRGIRDRLEKQLDYLANYACRVSDDGPPTKDTIWERGENPYRMEMDRTQCVLMSDHAPLSFFFHMNRKQGDGSYRTWFVGGCLFFAPGDTGVGSPQFSVRFGEDTSRADWTIHT